jgi:hypothetical protein
VSLLGSTDTGGMRDALFGDEGRYADWALEAVMSGLMRVRRRGGAAAEPVGAGSSDPCPCEFDPEALQCDPGARSSEIESVLVRGFLAAPFAVVREPVNCG